MTISAPDDSDYEGLNERIPGAFDVFVCRNCEITSVSGPNEICWYCLKAIEEEK